MAGPTTLPSGAEDSRRVTGVGTSELGSEPTTTNQSTASEGIFGAKDSDHSGTGGLEQRRTSRGGRSKNNISRTWAGRRSSRAVDSADMLVQMRIKSLDDSKAAQALEDLYNRILDKFRPVPPGCFHPVFWPSDRQSRNRARADKGPRVQGSYPHGLVLVR